MHLWDYDAKTIKNNTAGIRFKLERLINYGLTGKKIPEKLLKKHLPYLKIEPKKRNFLSFILWPK